MHGGLCTRKEMLQKKAELQISQGHTIIKTKPIFYCWLDLASTYFIKAGLLYLELQYCNKSVKSTRHNWLHFITD